jgi:hypothetical protein
MLNNQEPSLDPRCVKCGKRRSDHNFFGEFGYLCHNGSNTFLAETPKASKQAERPLPEQVAGLVERLRSSAIGFAKLPQEQSTADLLNEAARQLKASEQRLGDLLAVIHRDGGHYIAEHGMEKAVAVAMQLSSARITDAEGRQEAERRVVRDEAQAIAERIIQAAKDGYHRCEDYPPYAVTPWDDRLRWSDYLKKIAAEVLAEPRPQEEQ